MIEKTISLRMGHNLWPPTLVCIVKKLVSFWLGQLIGMAHKRTPAQAKD